MLAAKTIQPIIQQDWYCGPASVAMLYTAFGCEVAQDEIAEATGIREYIPWRGCRIDHLARAVATLTPDFVLLGKYNSSVDDLRRITEIFGVPAAVEWRGTFLEPNGHIWHEGHYSVVDRVDARDIHLVDPFNGKNIAHQNGAIGVDEFVGRWWDENYLPPVDAAQPDSPDSWTDQVWTDRLIAALIPRAQADALKELGMAPVTINLTRKHRKLGRTIDPTLSYRPTATKQQDNVS